MAKEFSKSFYNSPAWINCRAGYIASVFGLCERCNYPGHIVHHKIKLTPDNINDVNITLNWDNLEYLCLECHNIAHSSQHNVIRDDLFFDEYGEVRSKIAPP